MTRWLMVAVLLLTLSSCIGKTLEEMNRPYGTSGPGEPETEEETDQ